MYQSAWFEGMHRQIACSTLKDQQVLRHGSRHRDAWKVGRHLLVHDDGAQLTMVSDHDNLFCAKYKWDQGFRFCCLCALVQQHL